MGRIRRGERRERKDEKREEGRGREGMGKQAEKAETRKEEREERKEKGRNGGERRGDIITTYILYICNVYALCNIDLFIASSPSYLRNRQPEHLGLFILVRHDLDFCPFFSNYIILQRLEDHVNKQMPI